MRWTHDRLAVTRCTEYGLVPLGSVRVQITRQGALDHQALFCTACGHTWATLHSSDPRARWRALHTLCPEHGGTGSTLAYLWWNRPLEVDANLAKHELRCFNPTTPKSDRLVAAG